MPYKPTIPSDGFVWYWLGNTSHKRCDLQYRRLDRAVMWGDMAGHINVLFDLVELVRYRHWDQSLTPLIVRLVYFHTFALRRLSNHPIDTLQSAEQFSLQFCYQRYGCWFVCLCSSLQHVSGISRSIFISIVAYTIEQGGLYLGTDYRLVIVLLQVIR